MQGSLPTAIEKLRDEADRTLARARKAALDFDDETAGEAYGAAQVLFRQLGDIDSEAWCLAERAQVAQETGGLSVAREAYGEARALFHQLGDKRNEAACIKCWAMVAMTQEARSEARDAYNEALSLFQELRDENEAKSCLEYIKYLGYSDNTILHDLIKNVDLSAFFDTAKNLPPLIAGEYSNDTMKLRMVRLQAVANDYRLPVDIVARKLQEAATDYYARAITERATAEPRASQPMALMEDKTLARRQRRYEKLLAEIELPPKGFTMREQALAAANLATTYRRLRDRQIERGLEPLPKDERVAEADRLRVAFERAQKVEPSRRAISSPNQRRKPVVQKNAPRLH